MDIANRLRELREARGLSQAELAEKLGVTPGAIGMYETGKRVPKLSILETIADFFNVDMNYLYGTEDKTTRLMSGTEIALQEAFENRPEMRTLFSVATGCTKNEIEQAIKIIEALKK